MIQVGKRGQYDVVADGQTIASREGGMLTRLMGGGWPDTEDVLAELEKRLAAKGA